MSDQPPDGAPPAESDVTRPQPDSPHATRMIGPYRLLQLVGQGGMGEVWLAEQTHPVRRQVALKVIKAGMDTAQVVSRFEAERQALALMDHPAIATVFDGGSTPEGRPYFAMEYVKGEPITSYCDQQRLGMPERLALFMHVCEGVQHAHQKGVIHRDLKPSNVLVTLQDGQPVPKIIDFGVAKATTQPLTERTLYTELGVMIGTPEYMSPEQARLTGLDVDTRTDVYALGVLLYELLTGALPFDRQTLRKKALEEIQRTIREVDPPKPSTRVTQLGPASTDAARNRHTEAHRLASELRGDLDWITMKCLEKDRTRRYGSASELAADLRRHLDSQPVLASPPSTVYRAGKFVRRHRVGVAAAAAVGVLLVAFAVTMAVQAQRIAAERDRANREAARASQEADAAKQVTDFLVGLFKVSDPGDARGNTITAREVLDSGVVRIDAELRSQPVIQARLMTVMGQVYSALGLYSQAIALQRGALERRRQHLGARSPDTLESLHGLAASLIRAGDYADALPVALDALDGRRAVLGNTHESTLESLNNVTGTLFNLGRWGEAESGFRELLAVRERVLGPDHASTLATVSNLAAVLQVEGELGQSAGLYTRALAGMQKTLGDDHPRTLQVQYNLGTLAERQGELDTAAATFEAVVEARMRVLGADHADTLEARVSLATVRFWQKQYAESEVLARDGLARALRFLPPRHEVTSSSLVILGAVLNARGRYAEAKPLLEEGLKLRRAATAEHWRVAAAQCELGESLRGLQQYPAAESHLLEGCSGVLANSEPSTAERRAAAEHVIALYDEWGKPDKAAEWRAKLPKPAASTPTK